MLDWVLNTSMIRLGQKMVRQENLKDPDKMFSAKKYSKGKKTFLGRHCNVGIRSWIDDDVIFLRKKIENWNYLFCTSYTEI